MGIINILDKQTANLIAAGEVVERPASAIKEMLENCADAGAANVTVEIKDGGTTFIRITDDGCGMDKEDVPKTILRHATSKIKTGADLDSIGTLGFRGEALAAIAAVSRLRILTKRREDTMGTSFVCRFGEVVSCEDAGCPDGTTIIAENLFENTPARKKFLKKNATEAAAVYAVCEKFALSRPNIALTVLSDGSLKLRTPGDGKLKSAVYATIGKEFASNMLEADYTYMDVRAYGFIGRPENCRPNRNLQNFFVNGRFIKSRTMMAALEEGFRGFCPVGKFPACVLFLQLDLRKVDVNIHPAKLEVKFSEERVIFDAIFFAVKNALSRGITASFRQEEDDTDSAFPTEAHKAILKDEPRVTLPPVSTGVFRTPDSTLDIHVPQNADKKLDDGIPFETPKRAEKPQVKPASEEIKLTPAPVIFTEPTKDGKTDITPPKPEEPDPKTTENIGNTAEKDDMPAAPTPSDSDAPSLKGNPFDTSPAPKEMPLHQTVETQSAFISEKETAKPRLIGEAFDTYLLVERGNKLYFIDKHAAHERIIYERIKHASDNNDAQFLLDPIAVTLTAKEFDAAKNNLPYFAKIGFDAEEFGDDTFLVRSVPNAVPLAAVADTFTFLAGRLAEGNARSAGEIFDRALFTAACKAAIKGGNKDTDLDDEHIIHEIFYNDAVLYCPHGRPVLIEYTRERIEKLFGRT